MSQRSRLGGSDRLEARSGSSGLDTLDAWPLNGWTHVPGANGPHALSDSSETLTEGRDRCSSVLAHGHHDPTERVIRRGSMASRLTIRA